MNQERMNQESWKAGAKREPGGKSGKACVSRLASARSCFFWRESQETKRFVIC